MLTCTEFEGGVVCREEMKITTQRPDGDPRWCFVCRKRRPFEFVVWSPVGLSYYDPNPSIRCTVCETSDSDLFPGRQREWE